MGMFPVFIIGFLVGFILTYAVYCYKKDAPSETKLHIQEAEIIRYKSDIAQLEKLNEKLYEEIAELKNERKNKE
jgi:hypothetical protein